MAGEIDRIKRLEKEKSELEKALAKTQLKSLLLEAELELYKEEYGLVIKKKTSAIDREIEVVRL